jgi:fructose-specific PTS system IIB-like component
MTKIVGVTACPTGVAHTYMAAEAIISAAQEKNWDVIIETQGSIGIDNQLTNENIKSADIVILTTDVQIKGEERFKGKPVIKAGCSELIRGSKKLMDKIQTYMTKQ